MVREIVDDLLSRVFDGEAVALMHHLVHERDVSLEEIRDMRKLLDELESKDDGRTQQR